MSKQRIFNSAQEIENVFGVRVVLGDNLPENCNVVMYQLRDKSEIRPVDYFMENENGLFYTTDNGKMALQNDSLEDEVAWDYEVLGNETFIYQRLATKDNSDVFTPKRLLGVLTDHGYIQDVGILYVITTGYHYCTLEDLKFYISDDSDETVSFEEYVGMFYEG